MNALDIDDKLKDLGTTIISAFRIGKLRDNSSRPRNILVKLNNQEASNLITSNGKKLRAAGSEFDKVYIDRDYPPDIAKSLSELRKKAFEWRRDHPGEPAYVKSGKLYINGVVNAEINLK